MSNQLETLRAVGRSIIDGGTGEGNSIPLQQEGVVFRQMFEYSVTDFEAEVGFYTKVFGFPHIAMTEEYALFTDPDSAYCLSFRLADSTQVTGLKLLFMTTDIDSADIHLGNTGIVPDREIAKGSHVQRVIHCCAPSGLAIEIWEMPSGG